MQEKKLHDMQVTQKVNHRTGQKAKDIQKGIQYKQLPSHYKVGKYELIFFPKWIYKFWKYQQPFMWTLFFMSLVIYFFIFAFLKGYKVHFTQVSKDDMSSIVKSTIPASVYPVGGLLISTNYNKSKIILKPEQKIFKADDGLKRVNMQTYYTKAGRFLSLPVGIYNLRITAPNMHDITGKILIHKELVYKSYFYHPYAEPVKLEELDLSNFGFKQPNIKKVVNAPILLVWDKKSVKVMTLKNYKFIKELKYDFSDISYVLKNKKFTSIKVLEVSDIFFAKDYMMFLSKDYIVWLNLKTHKIKIWANSYGYTKDDVHVVEQKMLLYKDKYHIGSVNSKHFVNNIPSDNTNFIDYVDYATPLLVIDVHDMHRIKNEKKGWYDIYNNTLYFWHIKKLDSLGTLFDILVFNTNTNKFEVLKKDVLLPILHIKQIGFFGNNMLYILQFNNNLVFYPLDFERLNKHYIQNVKDLNNSKKVFYQVEWYKYKHEISQQYEQIWNNYKGLEYKCMGQNSCMQYIQFDHKLKLQIKKSGNVSGEYKNNLLYILKENQIIGFIYFSDDFARIDKPDGFYMFTDKLDKNFNVKSNMFGLHEFVNTFWYVNKEQNVLVLDYVWLNSKIQYDLDKDFVVLGLYNNVIVLQSSKNSSNLQFIRL